MTNNHPNRATLYTVLDSNGSVLDRHCTVAEAAHTVMIEDGHEYEIREGEYKGVRMFELWTSQFSRNSGCYNGLTKSVIFSLNPDRKTAEAEIYREVIKTAVWWKHCNVQSDEDYDAMLAETVAGQTDE